MPTYWIEVNVATRDASLARYDRQVRPTPAMGRGRQRPGGVCARDTEGIAAHVQPGWCVRADRASSGGGGVMHFDCMLTILFALAAPLLIALTGCTARPPVPSPPVVQDAGYAPAYPPYTPPPPNGALVLHQGQLAVCE
jgi:hypothetical protein